MMKLKVCDLILEKSERFCDRRPKIPGLSFFRLDEFNPAGWKSLRDGLSNALFKPKLITSAPFPLPFLMNI